ncbi:MAG: DUF2497 domain-containing protein [Pseudomonadota bacterium]|nr:DUF2497 domain-containing protein [Pseudomonadota bacterium]
MSDKNAQQDPSMEEILASIRRIITEDEAVEGHFASDGKGGEVAAGEDAVDSEGVLELTQMVQEDGSTVDLTEETEPEPDPKPEPEPEPETAVSEVTETLISEAVSSASIDTISKLAEAADSVPEVSFGLSFSGSGRTVEDLVVEMIRPMLREWLDENLPATVERIVQKEIRRLVRQAEPD